MPTFRAFLNILKDQRGQALVEIFISLGLLIIGALAMSSFSANIRLLKQYGPDQTRAVFLAEEGLEAARSLRDKDFSLLLNGTHGITLDQNGRWGLSGTSDAESEFTRAVTISTINPRLKLVTSSVTGPRTTAALTTALADIRQNSGAVRSLSLDLSQVSSEDGNKELRGMIIKNTGSSPIVITEITAWWEGDKPIKSVKLGNEVWGHNGPGTPSDKQPSGTLLNIEDVTLEPGQSENDTKLTFDGPVTGNFMVKFTLMDGTNAYVTIQPPQ